MGKTRSEDHKQAAELLEHKRREIESQVAAIGNLKLSTVPTAAQIAAVHGIILNMRHAMQSLKRLHETIGELKERLQRAENDRSIVDMLITEPADALDVVQQVAVGVRIVDLDPDPVPIERW